MNDANLRDIALPHVDLLHLKAALGWLELGNCLEANEELERISAQYRGTIQVLYLRWRVYAMAGKWEAAFDIARVLVALWPEEPTCWTRQAEALRHMEGGDPRQAWDALLPLARKFPEIVNVPYDLARYAAQLGWLEDARKWLDRAFAIDDSEEMKLHALDEPDLAPLWTETQKG